MLARKFSFLKNTFWFLIKVLVRLVDMQYGNNFHVFSTLSCTCVHEYIHCTVLDSGLPCCAQKCDHELTDHTKDVSSVEETV